MLDRSVFLTAVVLSLATPAPAQDVTYTFTGQVDSIGGVPPPAPWSGVQLGDAYEITLGANLAAPLILNPNDAIYDDTVSMGWSLSGIPQAISPTVANVLFVGDDATNTASQCCDSYQWTANIGSSSIVINLQECLPFGMGCPSATSSLDFPLAIPLNAFTTNNLGGINVGGSFVTGPIQTVNIVVSSGFTESCNGDGGDQMGCTDCPCMNNAPQGTLGGCTNSAGTSTRLTPSGGTSVTAADLRFEVVGAPPSTSAVLTSGTALAPANMANPCFGQGSGIQAVALDGLRCAVQGVLRHGVRPSDANGEIGVTTNGWGTPNGFFNFGAFVAGATKHFQSVHRDDSSAVCMTGQSSSQAVSVLFGP